MDSTMTTNDRIDRFDTFTDRALQATYILETLNSAELNTTQDDKGYYSLVIGTGASRTKFSSHKAASPELVIKRVKTHYQSIAG
ncbi:MAG: hypothetical protein ACI9VI_003539 [Candidatus Azotimanducaceae bacterium]|jgi:hypothetical protein